MLVVCHACGRQSPSLRRCVGNVDVPSEDMVHVSKQMVFDLQGVGDIDPLGLLVSQHHCMSCWADMRQLSL